MVHLECIRVHPIAPLDGTSVATAELDGDGPAWDRRYAIVDRPPGVGAGRGVRFVGRDAEPRLRDLETSYDLERETVTVGDAGSDERHTFHLELDRDCLSSWLSERVGYPVELVRDDEADPRDGADCGPTIVGVETLETVASWNDALDVAGLRRRLRPTLLVADGPPFWEDRLYGPPDRVVPVDIGGCRLFGTGPGTAPAADGDPDALRETFAERRRVTLPEWADERRFDHYHRLAAETRVPESSRGETLSIGDRITVGAPVPAPDPAD